MSTQTLSNIRISLRNDTASAWASSNPVLLKGEMAIEINTGLFKFGDGVKNYNDLPYANEKSVVVFDNEPTGQDWDYPEGTVGVNKDNEKAYLLIDGTEDNAVWKQILTPEDISDLGIGDMLKSAYATNEKSVQGYVDKAIKADKLTTERTVEMTGDVLGTFAFDGSGNVSFATALATITEAGTYTKVIVNEKGVVTGHTTLSADDIPALTLSKITDAGTAASKNVGTATGQIVMVGSDGKIDASLMPALSVTDVFTAASEAEMTNLSAAEKGDIVVRTDINETFILADSPSSTATNWIKLPTPLNGVQSVNGKTGANVTLNTDNISEGENNLYYTDARVDARIGELSASALADGATIIHATDSIILNGGSAALA